MATTAYVPASGHPTIPLDARPVISSSEPPNDAFRLKVLIVGAGIAGLATGASLRGFADVKILESTSTLGEIGAALSLGPNATAILTSPLLGGDLHDPYGGIDSEGIKDYDASQAGVIEFEHPMDYKKFFGSEFTFVHRRDLQTELLRLATRSGGSGKPCEIVLGAKVADVDCSTGTVTTIDGKTHTGDIIIGADGIRSKVRTFVIGKELPLVPSGYSAYRTTVEAAKVKGDEELLACGILNKRGTLISSQTKRVISYLCRGGETLNFVGIVPDSDLAETTGPSWTATSNHNALVRAFHDYHPLWKRLLSLGQEPGVWQLCDVEPLSTWVSGKCLLIGDAAHAMLPFFAQGASQSLEDAEAVSFVLSSVTSASAIPAALARIQSIRYKRASKVQALSRQCGFAAGTTGPNGTVYLSERDLLADRQWVWRYKGARDWEENQKEWIS